MKSSTRRVLHVWKVSETFPTPLFYLEKCCNLLGRTNFEINVLCILKVRDAAYGLSNWTNALLRVHSPNLKVHKWNIDSSITFNVCSTFIQYSSCEHCFLRVSGYKTVWATSFCFVSKLVVRNTDFSS